MSNKTKENVVLENIDANGGQVYRFGSGITDIMLLAGWDRAQNVKIGDKGKLVYRSTKSCGLWWFVKNGERK